MTTTITTTKRQVPWLGIGMSGEWETSSEALKAAELDFQVHREATHWNNPVVPIKDIPGYPGGTGAMITTTLEQLPMYANVRDTDNKVLGVVTPQYNIIQNADAFALADPFLVGSGGSGIISHVGMTEDGLVFMIIDPVESTYIGYEDYNIHLMLTNSFNGKYPCQMIMTPVRIICQNMYRKIVPDRVMATRHTINASKKIEGLSKSTDLEKRIIAFSEVIKDAQVIRMDSKKLDRLIAELFPYPKPGGAYEETSKEKVDFLRQQFNDVYYDAADNIEHHGTAFGFINAYMDYLSHREPTKVMARSWEDRRFSGLVNGADIKTKLIREAMK